MSPSIIGITAKQHAAAQIILDLFTKDFDKKTDLALVREQICAAVTALMRDKDLPDAILTDRGLWFPADMTDDEKIAYAGDIHPRLRKRLSARVWKGLVLRS